MPLIDPAFATVIAPLHDACEAASDVVIALWPDLRLGYVNPAFATFAAANGSSFERALAGSSSYLDPIAEPLRPFFIRLFVEVQRDQRPREHDYRCDGAVATRQMRLRVSPIPGGLLLVHHLIHEEARPEAPEPVDLLVALRSAGGFIVQCAHCRMVRDPEDDKSWRAVPALLAHPVHQISHGLCPLCFEVHYGADLGD